MTNPIKNFLRRHRAWFSASARKRSKAAKLGWQKRRLRLAGTALNATPSLHP